MSMDNVNVVPVMPRLDSKKPYAALVGEIYGEQRA